jgi:putative endonuclease
MGYKQEIGRWGEGIAASFLKKKGYSIVDRNYYTREGEIDLIALLEEEGEIVLVFVEVKTRTGERFGYPEEAFTRRKWDHLLRAINLYFEGQPDIDHPWQIDLVAIQILGNDRPPDIRHFENIVMGYD